MNFKEACRWLASSRVRLDLLNSFNQPLTGGQLCRRLRIPADRCSRVLRRFASVGLLRCLNAKARQNRLYWLTVFGLRCQQHTWRLQRHAVLIHECPDVDWDLYGWACHRHRSTVIQVLCKPMQPSAMKQRARSEYGDVRMSANNVRDVIKLLLRLRIVRRIHLPRRAHPVYELTKQGRVFRRLLIQAATGWLG